jgi:hypothetical protein
MYAEDYWTDLIFSATPKERIFDNLHPKGVLHIAKGQLLKPEKIVTLLRQIDVFTTNGKTLAQAYKKVGTVELPSLAQDLWRYVPKGIPFGQSRSSKELQRFGSGKYPA